MRNIYAALVELNSKEGYSSPRSAALCLTQVYTHTWVAAIQWQGENITVPDLAVDAAGRTLVAVTHTAESAMETLNAMCEQFA